MMEIKLKGQAEKYKIWVMAVLLAVACFLTYYFHALLGTGIIITHFLYIPIILAALWWKRKGLLVAIFLAVVLILSHLIARPDVSVVDDCFRALLFIAIAVVVAILSERITKEEAAALRESKEKYRSLVNNVKLGVFRSMPEPTGRFLEVNPAMEEITGYSREGLLQMKVSDLYVYPEEREVILEEIASAEGKATRELSFRKKDGTEIVVSDTKAAVRDDAGQILYFDGIIEDITERKRVEAELLRLYDAVRMSTDSIAISDLEGKIIDVNEATLKMYGTDNRAELIGKSSFDHIAPEEREKALASMKEVMAKGYDKDKEYHVPIKDGSKLSVEMSTSIMKGTDGEPIGFIGVIKDITERKQAEEALLASERKYRSFIESSHEVVFSKDRDGCYHTLNLNAAIGLGGTCIEDVEGKTDYDLLPKEQADALRETDKQLIESGKPTEVEEVVRDAQGKDRIYLSYKWPTYDDEGRIAGVSCFATDITERKQAEEREKQLKQELYLSSRLAAIGQLAAGVAHEINNPLTAVVGFSQLLLEKTTDEDIKGSLERIHNEGWRAAKVVENLLTFARRRQSEKQPQDINDVLQKALELRDYELKTSNIEVTLDLTPGLPMVVVDFHQIQEVFLNIILNAEQAMLEANKRGKLSIKSEETKGCIRVMFTDDGPGITAEHLDKLFDPFFTTRGERGGTGLGLSICHGIVTGHGGKIRARSKPGKGTTFVVELPAIAVGGNQSNS